MHTTKNDHRLANTNKNSWLQKQSPTIYDVGTYTPAPACDKHTTTTTAHTHAHTHLLRQYPLNVGPSLVANAEFKFSREQRPAVHELGHVLGLHGVGVQHPLRLRVEGRPVYQPKVIVVHGEGRGRVRVAERRLEETLIGDAELGEISLF